MEYITYGELPERLKCRECGSTHVKICGARKVEYELEEDDGKKIDETQTDEVWNVVYSVECLECGNSADPDEIEEQFGGKPSGGCTFEGPCESRDDRGLCTFEGPCESRR